MTPADDLFDLIVSERRAAIVAAELARLRAAAPEVWAEVRT